METNDERQEPRAERPDGKQESTPDGLLVVGIGASAGGLKALQAFFEALPDPTGLAFVVIMHLDPERESSLAELLQSHTEMPVQQVTRQVEVEPKHVYVIPPGQNLSVQDGMLVLSEQETQRGHRAPIDLFFRSLAEMRGESVGIVLSGGGTDGTVGLKAIKERGGLVMVQAPEDADHDSMPRSAIETGLVDLVLPAEELAERLVEFQRDRRRIQVPEQPEALPEDDAEALRRILGQLRARTGHDFSQYKESTVLRRIGRRMQTNQVESLQAYHRYLRTRPAEAQMLLKNLLISVTHFFRDREAWEALRTRVIPKLFEGKGPNDQVRVWVPGCATGEEASTVVLLLLEHADVLGYLPEIQVFASDLDEDALAYGRQGVYPEAVAADIPEERLRRFFTRDGDHFRVKKEVRERVLFATHSLLKDPPFSKLDLISCRNLLIYLNRELQGDVFRLFHYALRSGGYLFLGSAESAEGETDLFRTVDKKHRIYQRREAATSPPRLPSLTPPSGTTFERAPAPADPLEKRTRSSEAEQHRRMLEAQAPPSVLVDRDYRLIHLSDTAGRYLQRPGGTPSDDVLREVRPELRPELQSALHRAFEEGRSVSTQPVKVAFNGNTGWVHLVVQPGKKGSQQRDLALVLFAEVETVGKAEPVDSETDPSADPRVRELEEEALGLRERLQTTVEEYESSREEMKAANEELQSINEEYKSTAEELETSKEELQSVNEELGTVNQELKNKVEELSKTNSDLRNLMAAAEIGTLFLDRDLRIQRYTPRIADLFNVMPNDQGRPITHLTRQVEYDELVEDAEQVLRHLTPLEREVRSRDGTWFLVRLQPYRSVEDRIEGVVVTFVDITDRKAAEEALREAKEYAESIVETLHEPLLVLTPELRVESVNPAFYDHFEVDDQGTIGRRVYELGNGQWDIPELRTLLEDVLPANEVFNDYEVQHTFEDIGERVMLLNARRLDHVQLILLGIRDITDRKRRERALRESRERLEKMVNVEGVGVLILDEARGTLVDANDAFLAMHGYSRDEIEAGTLTWRDLTPEEYLAESERQLEHLAETGRLGPYEKEYFHKDGTRTWMLLAGASLGDGTAIEYCIDVSGRKRAEEALRRMNETLEERVEERTRKVKELASTLTMAEQEERHRISQVLHDHLQQQLYSIQMKMLFLREDVENENRERFAANVTEAEAWIGQAIETTRQLTVDLSPPVLRNEGLADALAWLVTQMQRMHGLQVDLKAEQAFVIPDQDMRVLLFQIVRELLFNVVKHAGVERAGVALREADGHLVIVVEDEGEGFDVAAMEARFGQEGEGFGLFSVRERLGLFGGRMEIASVPGDGARITVHVPVSPEGEARTVE